MKWTRGGTVSLWMATGEVSRQTALKKDIETEVCIVGAGIAGLSVAYELSKAGREVVVLDDGPPAGGETCRTTAHLSNALDERYFEMEKVHGKEGARLAAESHSRAIDRIEEIVKEEGIDCDFTRLDGYLFAEDTDSIEDLDKEVEAAHRAGLTDVERLDLPLIANQQQTPCLRFPNQGQFHVLKYLSGLMAAIQKRGGHIHSNTHADFMLPSDDGTSASVKIAGGNTVKSRFLVVATNTPINDCVEIHTKQAPYRSFVVGVRVAAGAVPGALYWDMEDPYHYVRLQREDTLEYKEGGRGKQDSEILIVGGEDLKTGQQDDGELRFQRLESWARLRWPSIQEVVFKWSGQIIESHDHLGFIGRNPMDKQNVYIVTGDSGLGMTHGTIAGMLISDLILGKENPWTSLYDPGRIKLRSAGEFISENMNAITQYTDYVTSGEVNTPEDISRGNGAVIRRGLKKVAVYRDEHGGVQECSAVCPHLGGIVHWNSTEKTWDCPVHGARFDPGGRVLNGPPTSNLGPADETE
jgi:glycine/D-amino acid oxidase-like deaminating enzyme/nitrite reductase/ring-hydroxylating ferredoxin subunit